MAHLGNTIVNGALRVLGQTTEDTLQVTSINGVTVGTSPKFTDENNKVTQTATTTNANYEVLFSATADNTTRTEGSGKAATLRFNPSTGSLMEGKSTVASGTNSHAEGSLTTANGTSCHAEGGNTKSVGDYSHSEGYMTTAINGSHAEGNRTIASKQDSHSEGYKTEAKGDISHAEGSYTAASGENSHTEGYKTSASGKGAHAEGGYTTATTGGGTLASGVNSHAEGYGTTASGNYSHAEGYNTLVVKELYDSMYGSHAEGYQTTCGREGSGKHAEGFKTSAYGTGSHSEGVSTIANNSEGSHAEGYYTTASGYYSHASGQYTCAAGTAQTVVGKYNVADTSSLFIVGNGNSSTRSNAFKVDSSGNFDAGNFKSEHSGYYGYTDLNSLPCNGYYWGRQNVPSVAAGNLAPDNTCGAITWKYSAQFEDQIAMDSYNSGALFTRSKTNGAWSTWKKVKMSDDQYVCSGVEYDPSRERVTKVTASDGWNSQIYSKRGYKNNVYIRFKAGQTNKAIMVGLNSDPTTDASYASIDFCWYLQNNGTLAIYESGTGYTTINSGTNVTYIAGEEFYIEVHDNKIYYYRNNDYYSEPKLERVSTNKTTSSSSNFNKLYFDSSFHDQSGFIYDVEFGVTTQTASGTLIYNEAGQGLLNHFPIAVSRNIVSSTTGTQQTTLQTFPYFSYCPPYHSLSVGEGALASKFEAFALGYNVEANANSSFATGEGTVANGECQTVIGKYNVSDSSDLLIIGNGSSDTSRSNALNIGANAVIYPKNGIQYSASSAGPNLSNNWISCGAGYSTGSGKSGLKLLSCEQSDCVSGLGQDCGGGPYELSIITGASTSNVTYVRFLKHTVAAPTTYTTLATLDTNGDWYCRRVVPSGSDYAEYFEWKDGNPNNEDRVGYFVTFDNEDKIKKASPNDEYILGVTSSNPSILGNSDTIDANSMYLKDDFGRTIYELQPEMEFVDGGGMIPKMDKDGNIHYIELPKPNPNYNPDIKPQHRSELPEWSPIGMLGILTVRDDGTCEVNGYCTVGENGIAVVATSSSINKYRVIKRRTENLIDIIFR